MSKQTAEVLQRAKERIEAGGLAQGAFFRGGACCALGALMMSADGHDYMACKAALLIALGVPTGDMLTTWNDAKDRTKEDVLSLFDKAIENELKNSIPIPPIPEKMSNKNEWSKKMLWHKLGDNFLVEVKHCDWLTDLDFGPHQWLLYAYIYPGHPLFEGMGTRNAAMTTAESMPLHWGCSYAHIHKAEDGSITSAQVGCDYHHLYDSPYTHDPDGVDVFNDAERLFQYLKTYSHP